MFPIYAFGGLLVGLAALWLVEHLLLVHANTRYVERMAPLFSHRGITRR
jgi:hypothetical protein